MKFDFVFGPLIFAWVVAIRQEGDKGFPDRLCFAADGSVLNLRSLMGVLGMYADVFRWVVNPQASTQV